MRQASLGDFAPELREAAEGEREHTGCFRVEDEAIVHPFVRTGVVAHRRFQLNIALRALEGGTLVVIPTGLGKTVIAALVIADVLHHKKGKVLMVAPTKPLATQHMQSLGMSLVDGVRMGLLLGTSPPKKRKEMWTGSDIVLATPQGIANDLENGRYDLSDVALIIFDEAHRAVGNYDYVAIARLFREQRKDGLVLGLTASPGSERVRIDEVVSNLGNVAVEARTENDPDVAPYVHESEVSWHRVKLTKEMMRARGFLDKALDERIDALRDLGIIEPERKGHRPSKKDLIVLGDRIRAALDAGEQDKGQLYKGWHHQAVAFHLEICLELLETQGTAPFLDYVERKSEEGEKSKALTAFLSDHRVKAAHELLSEDRGSIHPKMGELMTVVKGQLKSKPDSLVIVFSQSRDTITYIMDSLLGAKIEAERFVGQAHRKGSAGLSQKQQVKILDRFRKREFNALVASSVAEEGLDVPAVDLVVFYEPVPSAIRTIQRRGRTGRGCAGKIAVLITEDTRDEGFLRAEIIRERKMKGIVKRMAGRKRVEFRRADETGGEDEEEGRIE